ncbi:hypothetical protein D8S82_22160 [Mycobacterium hodleri]|uniref:Uncharacterized protein n=1 Tax=Mycolicibacterium hodleri TaxID=49897 RepID=A0A544VWR0_9MYCO|nr:hypothetical protein [Mycolicibacterium hodleri]TQR84413.1 hypothetical protein D8S82_22160 [Mycolicibacterium hodleri]
MTDIEIGGIYRAVAMDRDTPSALVLMTNFDETTQSVTATLLSPDVEFGSSADLVLFGDEIGRTYDLIGESDIFGYMWVVQLERRIGRVDAQVLEALSALREEDVVDRPVAGPPIVDRSDPRWNFKLHELKRLQRLTTDCTRELIDGGRVASIDPNALRAPSTEMEVAAFEEFVVEVVDGVNRGTARVPGWLVDIALDEELVEAYRAVGLYHSLRLLWRLADPTDAAPATPAAGSSMEHFQVLQVEMASASGHSSLWLLGRSTDIRGPIEARPARTRNGRLVQIGLISASVRTTQSRRIYA